MDDIKQQALEIKARRTDENFVLRQAEAIEASEERQRRADLVRHEIDDYNSQLSTLVGQLSELVQGRNGDLETIEDCILMLSESVALEKRVRGRVDAILSAIAMRELALEGQTLNTKNMTAGDARIAQFDFEAQISGITGQKKQELGITSIWYRVRLRRNEFMNRLGEMLGVTMVEDRPPQARIEPLTYTPRSNGHRGV